MKFGKYLAERKTHLPAEYAEHCIDYDALKLLLKRTVYEHSIRLDPEPESSNLPLSKVIANRLGKLQQCEQTFLEHFEQEVAKASAFFESETARLQAEKNTEPVALLQSILTLERFVFLNYTGVTKILKKNDRHSGLVITDACMQRVSRLPMVQGKELAILKQSVMSQLNERPGNAAAPPINNQTLLSAAASATSTTPPATIAPDQRILVSMAGPHGTDIIGAVLECLARHPCDINDCMLSRLYHNVTFVVLITLRSDNVAIFHDLADAARKWEASLTFDVPDTQATEPTVKHKEEVEKKRIQDDLPQPKLPPSLEEAPYSGRVKYSATILNQEGLHPAFLSDWTQLCLKYRISVEKLLRLNKDDRMLSCAEFRLSVPSTVRMNDLRTDLFELSASHGTDIALQRDDVFRKNKRLVVFDMDSTLIRQEVIDEIARYAGVVEQVAVSIVCYFYIDPLY